MGRVWLPHSGQWRPLNESLDGMNDRSIAAARKYLRGGWRSDRRRPTAKWQFPKPVSDVTRRKFFGIFGRTTWDFRQRTCVARFDEMEWVSRYKVLWANEESVVVLFADSDGESCRQLYIVDEQSFFIVASNPTGNVEYFKRHPV